MASSGGARNSQWRGFRFEVPRHRRCGEWMSPSPLRRGLGEVAMPLPIIFLMADFNEI